MIQYIRQLREYTNLTTEQISDELLLKMYEDSLLLSNIKLDEAIGEMKRSIINAYPFITKTLTILEKLLSKIGMKE